MNDFSKSSELLFAILYADDTNIFLEGNSYTKIILELNTELLQIESWLVANRLTLNVSKTHYMIFHRSRIKTVDHDLILNGNVVKRVTSTEFLGIIVDDQLKWKQHIDYFSISNGVRQGGILSPKLFSVYVDDLSDKLVESKVGCSIDNLCMNHVMYADDICFMALSPAALQELINICYDFSV